MEPPRISKKGLKRIETDIEFSFYHHINLYLLHASFDFSYVKDSEKKQLSEIIKEDFYFKVNAFKQAKDFPKGKLTHEALQKFDDFKGYEWTENKIEEVFVYLQSFKPSDYDKLVR